MVVLRLLGFLLLAGLGSAFLLYFLTRDHRYLAFAWGLLRFGLVFAVLFLALYALERIVLII